MEVSKLNIWKYKDFCVFLTFKQRVPIFYFRNSITESIVKIIEKGQLASAIREGPQGEEDAPQN